MLTIVFFLLVFDARTTISCATRLDATSIIREASTTDIVGSDRFLRDLELDTMILNGSSPSREYSLTADPLPSPPSPSADFFANYAVDLRPELFSVSSPVNIPLFAKLLLPHPNRALVLSVIRGLQEGFMPPLLSELPVHTIDRKNYPCSPKDEAVIRDYRDKEIKNNRFSPGFTVLSCGMQVSPLFVVTNENSGKKRVVTDMSATPFPMNSFIDKNAVSVPLDRITNFAPTMLRHRREKTIFEIWKSDVEAAYLLLFCHPFWMFRQVVRVGNLYHIDRCLNFGSASSPRIWCTFFSLILWITDYHFGVKDLNTYMDDSFGVNEAVSKATYKGRLIPLNQAKFLLMFDYLRIPWAWNKQVFGLELEIIGYWIDCRELLVSLRPDKRLKIVADLREFTRDWNQPLQKWWSIAGSSSWTFNVFPLGRWVL